MKTLFKCLFFTLLVLKVSNAMASNYVYAINYHDNHKIISICSIKIATGNIINPCKTIDPATHGLPDNLKQVTISPNGTKAYLANDNNIYACLINNDTGYLGDCPNHHVFPESYGKIADIIVNPTSDKFYVSFMRNIDEGSSRSRRYETLIMMCSSKTFECSELDINFAHITSIRTSPNFAHTTFIRISSDNRYAYLISQDIYKHEFKFYACPIQPDGTFDHDSCHITELNHEGIFGISDIAVTKNAVYLVVQLNVSLSNKHHWNDSRIRYCPLENSGANLGTCVFITTQDDTGRDMLRYSEIQMLHVALDNTNKHAYIGFEPQNSILSCTIVDNNFKNCKKEFVYFVQGGISSIAYRRDRPHDDSDHVTLHFKP